MNNLRSNELAYVVSMVASFSHHHQHLIGVLLVVWIVTHITVFILFHRSQRRAFFKTHGRWPKRNDYSNGSDMHWY